MKKTTALVLVMLLLSALCLSSCAEKAVTTVNVKILVGTSSDGELKNFKTETTLYDGTLEIEGDKITVNTVLNHINNKVEGLTCDYSTNDTGEAEFVGINSYDDKNTQTSQYLYDMGDWRFVVNNASLELGDTVENGSTMTIYYMTWTFDATPS